MREITIQLFKVNELTDEAKEKAISDYLYSSEVFWVSEWLDSLSKFCELFDVELCDYSVSSEGVDIKYNIEYLHYGLDFEVDKLWFDSYNLETSCPFTGYCGDESLLDPLRALKEGEFVKRVDILKQCLTSWCEDFQGDVEEQQSSAYVLNHLEANEFEFLEDGSIYNDPR